MNKMTMRTLHGLSKGGIDFESGARLARIWPSIVGANLTNHLRPVSLVKGTLTIEGSSAGWTQEARFLETALLQKLCKALGEDSVRELRFRTARSWKVSSPPVALLAPVARFEGLSISAQKAEIIDGIVEKLEDTELRERLRRIFRLASLAELERSDKGR